MIKPITPETTINHRESKLRVCVVYSALLFCVVPFCATVLLSYCRMWGVCGEGEAHTIRGCSPLIIGLPHQVSHMASQSPSRTTRVVHCVRGVRVWRVSVI